jgi:hypothetical protein
MAVCCCSTMGSSNISRCPFFCPGLNRYSKDNFLNIFTRRRRKMPRLVRNISRSGVINHRILARGTGAVSQIWRFGDMSDLYVIKPIFLLMLVSYMPYCFLISSSFSSLSSLFIERDVGSPCRWPADNHVAPSDWRPGSSVEWSGSGHAPTNPVSSPAPHRH